MKLVYTHEDKFKQLADPDNPRRPLLAGGVFRNSNAWDGVPEQVEAVFVDSECAYANEIVEMYEQFVWHVPGRFQGQTLQRRAAVHILSELSPKALAQSERGKVSRGRGQKQTDEDGAGDAA